MEKTAAVFNWEKTEDRERFVFQLERHIISNPIKAIVVSSDSISCVLDNGVSFTLESEKFDMILSIPVTVTNPETEVVQ